MDIVSSLRTKVEEKKPEWILLGITALVALLASAVWAAIPSETWARISELTPKKALWLSLAATSLLVLFLVPYVFLLRRERDAATAQSTKLQDLIDNPPRVFRFGVYWDKDLIPYCPVHKDIPLSNWGKNGPYGPTGYVCPADSKGHVIQLRDDDQPLTPAEARRLLAPDAAGQQSAPALPPEPELDKESERLLRIIATPNYERDETALYQYMSLHPERIRHYLDLLEEGDYIYAIRVMMPDAPTTYHLDRKGREYAMKRHWI